MISRGETFLIARRRPNQTFPMFWELPGGKCVAGESPRECILREVREETGLEVEVVRGPLIVEHDYQNLRVSIHVFLCRILSGEAAALQSDAIAWIYWHEIINYDFPEANRRIFERAQQDWVAPAGSFLAPNCE